MDIHKLTTPPVVGQSYNVPVVLYRHVVRTTPEGEQYEFFKIPILDPRPHTDPPNFPLHYHIDLRFYDTDDMGRSIVCHRDVVWSPSYESMVCIREMPEYNYVAPPLAPMLNALYSDKGLSSCKRCPHQNQYVGNCSTRDNIIECPAHGLRFDADTGKVTNRKRTSLQTD